jgi:hypothetical protein
MIDYRFRVPSTAVFTLYSYSKVLESPLRVMLFSARQSLHPNFPFSPERAGQKGPPQLRFPVSKQLDHPESHPRTSLLTPLQLHSIDIRHQTPLLVLGYHQVFQCSSVPVCSEPLPLLELGSNVSFLHSRI